MSIIAIAIFFGPSRHPGFPQVLIVSGFAIVLSLFFSYIATLIEGRLRSRSAHRSGVDIYDEPFLYMYSSVCGALAGSSVALLVSLALPPWREVLG